MAQWLKERFEILQLSLKHPVPLLLFGSFQLAAILLAFYPPSLTWAPFLAWLTAFPWYGWAIGWLIFLWFSTLEYSVQRKNRFDETSLNFFRAYLDFLIQAGHKLFQHSGEKDFYSKINDWHHQAIQGIAIGLGPVESEKFFQRVEAKNPLSEAYRESTASKSGEPLSRWLQNHLEELGQIRLSLPENQEAERKELAAYEGPQAGPSPPKKMELLPGEVKPPSTKRFPKA
jgi:hypothetical protein